MLRIILLCAVLSLLACGESIEATKVEGRSPQAFEKNPTDAVGVAEGDRQVSPFGKPAH
ncbi:MAG: hypothetical protein Q9M19_02310 [Mariprofundaceae bacterium]|nr:hypothetical protein [Mariprofundaceae bacterium]